MQRVSLALVIVLCLAAGPVYAGCTNPAGNEGDAFYNKDYHTWQFCNGTQWMSMGGIGTGGPVTLISTQTASSSASLQFTNLPTSYNTLFLNCTGLLVSSSSTAILLRVGEGPGPTWETGSNYSIARVWSSTSGSGGSTGSTNSAADVFGSGGGSSTVPQTIKAYIDNVGSSSLYKNIFAETALYSDAVGSLFNVEENASWYNDTNPITGLQLAASTGTIVSGTCTLYGMN
jgi:hypothetical protein